MPLAALLAALLALGAGASSRPAAESEISAGAIAIGGIGPTSGPAAQAARGAQAYFDHVNELGGVHGRRIEFRYVDGGADPQVILETAQQLVNDGVLALFATAGTAESLAIRTYLARMRVPQLFVASGSSVWGRDAGRYPRAIGYAPTYRVEAQALARHILRTRPRAKVGVLYEPDADGKELLAAFRRALGTRGEVLVEALPYDLAVGRLEALRVAGADTFVNLAAEVHQPAWARQIYASSLAAGQPAPGTVAPVYVKDPSDPRWTRDAGLAPFRPLRGAASVRGLAAAFTLVDALRRVGPNLTRGRLTSEVRTLNEASNPFLLPGIVVRTGPTDAYPIEQVALQRYRRGRWNVFTGLLAVPR